MEKYKVTDVRFSRLSMSSKNYLKGKKRKVKKIIQNIPKKIIIKVDNHNVKMINNYLNKLKTNKSKEKNSKRKKEDENSKTDKNKEKEKEEIFMKKKDEKRIRWHRSIPIRIIL